MVRISGSRPARAWSALKADSEVRAGDKMGTDIGFDAVDVFEENGDGVGARV